MPVGWQLTLLPGILPAVPDTFAKLPRVRSSSFQIRPSTNSSTVGALVVLHAIPFVSQLEGKAVAKPAFAKHPGHPNLALQAPQDSVLNRGLQKL